MTIGTLVAFWQLLDQFFTPIEDLSDKYSILQAAMASSERIFQLLDTQPTVTDPVDPKDAPAIRGEIAFDHVSFAYNDEEWVLNDIDFTILGRREHRDRRGHRRRQDLDHQPAQPVL